MLGVSDGPAVLVGVRVALGAGVIGLWVGVNDGTPGVAVTYRGPQVVAVAVAVRGVGVRVGVGEAVTTTIAPHLGVGLGALKIKPKSRVGWANNSAELMTIETVL